MVMLKFWWFGSYKDVKDFINQDQEPIQADGERQNSCNSVKSLGATLGNIEKNNYCMLNDHHDWNEDDSAWLDRFFANDKASDELAAGPSGVNDV